MAARRDAGRSAYAAAGKAMPSSPQAGRVSAAPDRFVMHLWLAGDCYGTLDTPETQQNWNDSLPPPEEMSLECILTLLTKSSRVRRGRGESMLSMIMAVTLAMLHWRVVRECFGHLHVER